MPKFSQRSLDQLSTCHESLQILCKEAIKRMDFVVLEGFRNQEKQDEAFRTGHSKLKWPNGNHNQNPSIAVDIAPYPNPFGNIKDNIYLMGYVLGLADMLYAIGKMKYKCRVGCDWNQNGKVSDESFVDACHVELIGVP